MSKSIAIVFVLLVALTSCKKYYNCACTNSTQTVTSLPNAINTTYSTTITTYTVPVDATKAKSVSACGALGGSSGLTTISCGIE